MLVPKSEAEIVVGRPGAMSAANSDNSEARLSAIASASEEATEG